MIRLLDEMIFKIQLPLKIKGKKIIFISVLNVGNKNYRAHRDEAYENHR